MCPAASRHLGLILLSLLANQSMFQPQFSSMATLALSEQVQMKMCSEEEILKSHTHRFIAADIS